MWPILVKKPNGPWSNCYGGLGLLGLQIIGKAIRACPQIP